jgi:hypothetical protein
MTTRSNLALVLLLGFMLVAVSMAAQQSPKSAKQLVGTWTLVSIYNEQDGKKTDPFGSNPKGLMVVGSDGHFSRLLSRSDLPKFASNNRAMGTPEENKAVVQGSIAYFGTISCNAADKGCTFHLEASTFPNWAGVDQNRLFTLVGDELREVNSASSTQTGKAVIVWKRVR